jgi:prevent-host-death family protein
MVSVGTYEAKTNLARLLERVEAGESILITRHGRPVAKIVPVGDVVPRRSAAEIHEAFERLRAAQPPAVPGEPPLWTLKHEGHKY